jgi:DNA-K related protein/Hsp70 protein
VRRATSSSVEMSSSRYLIGIDLGTTNSVVAYIDTTASAAIRVFDVEQVIGSGEVRAVPGLPSFLYFPTEAEIASGAFDLPWEQQPKAIVGVAAHELGALVPGRQVSSAKSWLCQDNMDPTAAILPREAEPPEPTISPVEASARYLMHLRDAWNHTMAPDDGVTELRFENQEIVLTVPASFDEEARELTVRAARNAGLPNLTLLEEPLAAFYAWISTHQHGVAEHVRDSDQVLICDIGGGTSDFSLVRAHVHGSEVQFERTAIGEHLLIGGENLDLALARCVEQKVNTRLSLRQRHALKIACSQAKERLLSDPSMDRLPINILGSGRAVVGQMLTSDLTRDQVVELLMNGFLPLTAANEMPSRARTTGLREVGLPYASDPAITKHLAAFLRGAAAAMRAQTSPNISAGTQELAGEMARPDAVLFNGGFCIPEITRQRILEVIAKWFAADANWQPRILRNPEAADAGMASAVAMGAAYYGQVRRGKGLRVKAGSARTYYIGTRSEGAAVCVLPAGTDEGTTLRVDREFTVLANRPVSFNLFSSTIRHDGHGALVDLNAEEVHRHAPLTTLLRYGKRLQEMELAVRLSVSFTEVGTLELWCESMSSPHRWRLQFELRPNRGEDTGAAPQSSKPVHVAEASEQSLEAARAAIRATFTKRDESEARDPAALAGELEELLALKKESWSLLLVRQLADTLLEIADGRKLSAQHEARWLNLAGFCLRPGFGDAGDAGRIAQMRKLYQSGLAFNSNPQNQVNWLVLWRRIAGGLSAAHQHEIRNYLGGIGIGRKKPGTRLNPQVERDAWRLLASLEHLSGATRAALALELLRKLKKEPIDGAWLWSLGRFGARIPLYGPLTCVVPAAAATEWIDELLALPKLTHETANAIVQLGRRTGDRTRDIAEEAAKSAVRQLELACIADDAILQRLTECIPPDRSDVARTFGEPLPKGLQLQSTADCLSPVAAIAV